MAAGPPPGAADAPRLPPRPAGQRRRAVAGRAAVGALRSCWSPPTWTRLGTPRKPAEELAVGVLSGDPDLLDMVCSHWNLAFDHCSTPA
ncbi:uncharacterized protein LOC143646853 isoform X5 [Tamandua tetradactyla]|uniref:uncharacterized protein LOC143646853 isoform X5 n=1 Tax=Tamandua tetradactyla TaxID=48850 RepID=UPI004053A927